MIKNPKLGQEVYYFVDLEIRYGKITFVYENSGNVEIVNWHYRRLKELFTTKESAEKHLPKTYEKSLKTLNKEIFELSKKREKLATKLAKLLEKG